MKVMKWSVLAIAVVALALSSTGCKSLAGAEITSEPLKTVYGQGQEFEATGLSVNATYSDGESKLVRPTVVGYDKHKVGTQKLLGTFGIGKGKGQVTFEVRVVPLNSISIATPPNKLKYNQGDEFNSAGLVVRADWEEIGPGDFPASEYKISGYDKDKPGTQTITITAEGQTADFTVSVLPLVALSIKSPAKKTDYFTGDSLDLSGLVLNGTFMDGTTPVQAEIKTSNVKISGFDSKFVGFQKVVLTMSGFSVDFTVTVTQKAATPAK